jgi:hypothetical protein
MAVDNKGNALNWDGTSWSSPSVINKINGNPEYLAQVSCPTSSFCVAVGDGGNVVAWNNGTWGSPDPINYPGSFYTVSCSSASFCMAFGGSTVSGYSGSAVYEFDGTSWTAIDTEVDAYLYS